MSALASREAPMTTTRTLWLVQRVLDGLAFPSQRWRILAQADLYGVDGVTRERLYSLPVGRYESLAEVASVLDGDSRPQVQHGAHSLRQAS
jgi:hypothetical protein